jgi:hypothetical protein
VSPLSYCLGQDFTGKIKEVFNTSLTMPTFLANFSNAGDVVMAF